MVKNVNLVFIILTLTTIGCDSPQESPLKTNNVMEEVGQSTNEALGEAKKKETAELCVN